MMTEACQALPSNLQVRIAFICQSRWSGVDCRGNFRHGKPFGRCCWDSFDAGK